MNLKALSFLVLAIVLSLSAIAQKQDSISPPEGKFYIGIGLVNISHHIYYKNSSASGEVKSGYFTPFGLNIGYNLNKRASLQAGLAYGGSKDQAQRFSKDPANIDIEYNFNSQTTVIAVPITMRFIAFNSTKKLPIYATATLMSALGKSTENSTKTYKNETVALDTNIDKGINTFFTAGLGVNFKLRNHFAGFTEVQFLKSNLAGFNSRYYDWNFEQPKLFKFIASLGFGINYNL